MANLPTTLEPTGWKPITIVFTPTEKKAYESVFKINTSVGVFSYTLKGTGYDTTPDPNDPTPDPSDGSSTKIPKATTLVSEFYNNEDLDGNGLIYGYDFKITDDDNKPPKKPVILCIVEKSPYWTNPTTEKTWDEFVGGTTPAPTPNSASLLGSNPTGPYSIGRSPFDNVPAPLPLELDDYNKSFVVNTL